MKCLTSGLLVKPMLWLPIILFLASATSYPAGEILNQSGQGVSSGRELDIRNESTVLLRYTQALGWPRNGRDNPSLTIYNDGFIRVFYPPYLKRAGTYAAQVDRAVLDQVWQMLTTAPLLEFDAGKARELMALHDQTSGYHASEVHSISDAPTIFIEFYPNRYYAPGGVREDVTDERKLITWYALQWDAGQYPEITEIQQLYAVHQRLEEMMQHSNLIKINEAQ